MYADDRYSLKLTSAGTSTDTRTLCVNKEKHKKHHNMQFGTQTTCNVFALSDKSIFYLYKH